MRSQAGFRRFFEEADERGLVEPLRDIARRHGSTLRDVYGDSALPGAIAARLESWWWLTAELRRSPNEVAILYDRRHQSVAFALRRLALEAERSGVRVASDTVAVLAGLVSRRHEPEDG